MNKEIFIDGWININDEDALCVDSEYLTRILEDKIQDKFVEIDYYVSNKHGSYDDAMVQELNKLEGIATCECKESWGSSWTGKYWHEDIFKVKGRDLVSEISNHDGKYLNMKITITKEM